MKRITLISSLTFFLLLPFFTSAEYTIPVIVQGKIGDFSRMSRDYEIDGNIYHFPADIVLVDKNGAPISFDRLKAGSVIKVVGEKTIGTYKKKPVKFMKIILLKE